MPEKNEKVEPKPIDLGEYKYICENLPDVTNDISDAAWQIEFAHDI